MLEAIASSSNIFIDLSLQFLKKLLFSEAIVTPNSVYEILSFSNLDINL